VRAAPIRHTSPIDPVPDNPREQPTAAHHRRAHTRARDIERYGDLFATRTRGMRSSVMRDLMEITARPEVISLAGGLPDTSTFPPELFAAQMARIAQESAAEALQYGPTEGFGRTKRWSRRSCRPRG
jgi:2-aminoadipate transaminase